MMKKVRKWKRRTPAYTYLGCPLTKNDTPCAPDLDMQTQS